MPSFPIHLSNSAETLPRAPITTGTISAFLNFHNLLISFFKSWYFYSFSLSFSSTLTSAGTAISIIIPVCSFLSIIIRSGRLASIRLSHWIFMSHSTLISSFSTAPSGACLYHFSLCSNLFSLQICQWTFFATLCRLSYNFWTNFSHPLVMCCIFSPFFPTQSTQGAFAGLIDVILHLVRPDSLLLCGTQQYFCTNL